jgi:hypothetical protein
MRRRRWATESGIPHHLLVNRSWVLQRFLCPAGPLGRVHLVTGRECAASTSASHCIKRFTSVCLETSLACSACISQGLQLTRVEFGVVRVKKIITVGEGWISSINYIDNYLKNEYRYMFHFWLQRCAYVSRYGDSGAGRLSDVSLDDKAMQRWESLQHLHGTGSHLSPGRLTCIADVCARLPIGV